MANFFKDYQKQAREKRQAEQARQHPKKPDYNTGDLVRIDKRYDHTEKQTGKKYFVCYAGDTTILLADTKAEAERGRGYLYSIFDIIA